MKKNIICKLIIPFVTVLLLSVIYLYSMSQQLTEWGEHETIKFNSLVSKERPATESIGFLKQEYDDDFHRYLRICGQLALYEIDGECVLDIFEGDVKKYSVTYPKGIHDIDFEWESYPGDGKTYIRLSTDGTVYDAEFNYALYSRSSKLNYLLSRIKRRMGII